ncbi:vacuolar amino acid transporter 1 [Prunus yedoensis var. nudiflora]|uniref:Vacuolar amino acid transporter 1 n=1 Tax=Prunus yedoensis var. nudiflora TaxID=2094558 RepID=A0A314YC26_PRUYE|nr:vacuolar amino acid transporter 1 [Prunus yedoensis var. nudiflora]
MNNSVSDRSFYIESEDEEDEEKEFSKSIEDGGNDSESSESFTENQQQNIPSSYNTQWPQSYRQSIDLYSSVPSPSIGFLGTPTLSRLGSSFLSSSLTRRHTPETLPFLTKPSVPIVADEQQQQHRDVVLILSFLLFIQGGLLLEKMINHPGFLMNIILFLATAHSHKL